MDRIERIILIDDNDVTNFFNFDLLMSMDPAWEVKEFTDPEKALAYFQQNAEAMAVMNTLVLLDIKMPGLTGFDLLRELDELDLLMTGNMRFCILTSSNLVRDHEELLKFPAIVHYLEKPLDPEKIGSLLSLFNKQLRA